MLPLLLDPKHGQPLHVLCLGAHCDDIEIGCGGTMMRLARSIPSLDVRWVVFTGSERRHAEARRAANAVLDGHDNVRIELHSFRESFLPEQWALIKEEFERIKGEYRPDLIFTHYRADAHQDHRVIAELTWNTFRNHLILEYEVPKFEGDLGNPNLFVPLQSAIAERKVGLIMDSFVSQHGRPWFDARTFLAMLRLRGMGCNAGDGLAEAFHTQKLLLNAGC